MRTKFKKIYKKKYLLREAYLIIIFKKLYIFYCPLKKINCYILIRKHIKFKSEEFRWYHAKSPITIELIRELFKNPRICVVFKDN